MTEARGYSKTNPGEVETEWHEAHAKQGNMTPFAEKVYQADLLDEQMEEERFVIDEEDSEAELIEIRRQKQLGFQQQIININTPQEYIEKVTKASVDKAVIIFVYSEKHESVTIEMRRVLTQILKSTHDISCVQGPTSCLGEKPIAPLLLVYMREKIIFTKAGLDAFNKLNFLALPSFLIDSCIAAGQNTVVDTYYAQ